jgi:single-stranded DNA-binding protein
MIVNNKTGCIAIGKISKEPEQRQAGNGMVTNFSLIYGYEENQLDDKGRRKAKFIDIAVWNGEDSVKLLRKGDKVLVAGRLGKREYNGKEYYTITADAIFPSLGLVDTLTQPAPVQSQPEERNATAPTIQFTELDEDDGELPF